MPRGKSKRGLKDFKRVKQYFEKNAVNGRIEDNYTTISANCQIKNPMSVRNYILEMEKEGYLTFITRPERGKNHHPIIQINHLVNTKDVELNKKEDNKIFNRTKIMFEGYTMDIISTEIGLAIRQKDLAIATLSDVDLIKKIVEANKELFVDNITILDNDIWFNKSAVLHYLMKINIDSSLPVKKKILAEFQNNVVTKMGKVLLEGKVILTDEQKVKIIHNLHLLTEIAKEDVEKIFHTLEDEFNSVFNVCHTKLNASNNKVKDLQSDIKHEHMLLENERKRSQALLLENQEVRAKLMSRE